MTKTIMSFRDLRIWQDGITLVRHIYRVTGKFPKQEFFGLTSQTRRAAISVPSNIAEGHIRRQTTEFKRFLYISLGSLAELETQLVIAADLKFLNDKDYTDLIAFINSLGKQIRSLILRLTNRQSLNPNPRK